MPQMRIRDAAAFLGVSDDTVRRWIESGSLAADTDESGRKVLDGYELAKFARAQATTTPNPLGVASSARNRFVGLVTDIKLDEVMAQVELQCGPFRVVSLMSSEAVRDLELELGSVAVAVVKSTTVIVETPAGCHEALGRSGSGRPPAGHGYGVRLRRRTRPPGRRPSPCTPQHHSPRASRRSASNSRPTTRV